MTMVTLHPKPVHTDEKWEKNIMIENGKRFQISNSNYQSPHLTSH